MEPCFLPSGREVLFSCGHGIYLRNLDTQRVGRVASGRSYTVIQNAFANGDAL